MTNDTNSTTNATETVAKPKVTRHRRTVKERLEALEQERLRLLAIQEGTYDETQEDGHMVKRLKAAIRRRETVIKAAGTLVNGRAATANSPMLPPIAVKITNAENAVKRLKESLDRAVAIQAAVPFDIEVLTGLLAKAQAGDAVEFPTNLHPIQDDSKRTDAEVEAASVVV